MLFAVLALTLSFTPTLPEDVPDTSGWQVMVNESFTRPVAADVIRLGGLTLKFVQTRNICPKELQGDCTYFVQHELRRKMQDGKMVAFLQRYIVVGPKGTRDEGVCYFENKDDGNTMTFYFRKNGRWLSEERGTEEWITAGDFFQALAQRHQGEEGF